MKPNPTPKDIAHRWMLGSYVVYAQNLYVARRAYEWARAQPGPEPFGTIELESGEVVDWINMDYDAIRDGQRGRMP